MPSKRRNNGRAKKNKGKSVIVRCCQSGRCVPKDKAIKRFQMRNIVDGSSRRDIKDNFAYDQKYFTLPKIYVKQYYSISCAIHAKIVRVRSAVGRAGAKGDRFKRYTTKLRDNVNTFAALTGTAAIPLIDQNKFKFLKGPGGEKNQRV